MVSLLIESVPPVFATLSRTPPVSTRCTYRAQASPTIERCANDSLSYSPNTASRSSSTRPCKESPTTETLVHVTTPRGDVTAKQVIACAGLHSDRLARTTDPSTTERIMPFRGDYFELTPERRHLVNGLIYPVPDPAFPFLGVHLTRMIDGSIHAGPNAVPALSREGYRWRDISPRDTAELVANPGAWRLARSYWKTGLAEIVRSASKRRFVAALQRLVPAVQADDLVRSPAGVRAQAISRDGRLIDDFTWAGRGKVLNVLNAPSPAATASLALADEIVDRALHTADSRPHR
jgi:L-2-hydroxyglutarate oxidase